MKKAKQIKSSDKIESEIQASLADEDVLLRYLLEQNEYNFYIKNNADIKVEWTTGGITGGNCYGDRADRSLDADLEPEFRTLDDILLLLSPNITYLQHKMLCREIIYQTTSGYSDYYGNYTNTAIKSFNISNLINYLLKHNLIDNSLLEKLKEKYK